MAKRFARKVKRAGKSATQFRFTSTFEYIDLTCNGTWRPGNLRLIWLRSHRRVQSSDVEFVVTEDRGPNGADGRAVFDPPISASLIVTLYRDGKKQEFEEKEYKYYIENEDKNGKKILASFNCDMAEYAGIPSARHALEMNFKPVSRKVSKSLLGITLEAEFQKEGKDTDDDMQSTFSSVDPSQSIMYADDEEDVDDEELDEAATLGMRPKSAEKEEEEEETPATNQEDEPGPLRSIVVLGTGETLRRSQLHLQPPPIKPPRSDKSMENLLDIDKENEISNELETQDDEGGIVEEEKPSNKEKAGNKEIVKDGKDELMEGGAPESCGGDVIEESKLESLSSNNDIGRDGVKQEEEECSGNMEKKEEECSSSKELGKKEEECSSSSKETKEMEQEEKECSSSKEIKEKEEECSSSKETKEMEQEEKECSSSKETKEKAKEEECSSSKELGKKEEECSSSSKETKEKAKEEECSSSKETKEKEEECSSSSKEGMKEEEECSSKKEESNKKEEGPCGATPIDTSAPPTKDNSEPHSCDEEMPQNDTASKGTKASTTAGKSTAPVPMTEEAQKNGQLDHPGPPIGSVTAGASGGPADKQPSTEPQDGSTPQGANPFDEPAKEQSPPPTGPGRNAALVKTWLPDAQYVDCHDVGVGNERVDSADVIGLYFSAQWCPPCRRFLPKLLEFYTSLKKNNKSFEMIYISNDNSRTEMIQYMAEQQMPWVAIPHSHPLIDKLKLDFKVRSIPLLVIVSASGETLDDNAKKVVEGTHVAASSTIKQYNKWLEKAGKSADDEEKQKTGGGGILGSIKKALGGKDDETPPTSPATETQHVREAAESKSHKTTVNDKHNKDELLRQLQQKEDIIRHLEEVNQSLKITNDELNTEVRTLKTGLDQSEAKVRELEASTAQKRQEDEKLREHLKVQGWLFKKGAKGPTANVFRRRYFRLDQGSRLYYYKSQSEGTPQGFIDLAKVIEVSAAEASKQDKNNGSFNINCEGRVFELLAHDETERNKWISAITYLARYFKEKGASPN